MAPRGRGTLPRTGVRKHKRKTPKKEIPAVLTVRDLGLEQVRAKLLEIAESPAKYNMAVEPVSSLGKKHGILAYFRGNPENAKALAEHLTQEFGLTQIQANETKTAYAVLIHGGRLEVIAQNIFGNKGIIESHTWEGRREHAHKIGATDSRISVKFVPL